MAKTLYCAECGAELKGYYYIVGDNYLQVKYFDCPEGSDNMFCSQNCMCESLSVLTVDVEQGEEDGEE